MEKISAPHAAKLLGISVDKLVILEKQGLIHSTHNTDGVSFYSSSEIAQIKSRRGLTLSEEAAQVGIGIQREMASSISFIRKVVLVAGTGFLSYCFLVIVIAVSFSLFPLQTASLLGYVSSVSQNVISSENPDSNVLAAETSTVQSPLQTIFQPIGKASLGIVQLVNPNAYAEVASVTILDPNDVLYRDSNGTMTPIVPIKIPQSSSLDITTSELIANLNSQYLQGKKPGTEIGDLAVIGQNGIIEGLGLPTSGILQEVVLPTGLAANVEGVPTTSIEPDIIVNNSTTSITGLTNSNLSGSAGITNSNLANPAVTISTQGPLTGGGAVSLGSTLTLDCPTCVTPGGTLFTAGATTGSDSQVAQGATLTLAAGTNLTTVNNGAGTITFATSANPTFSTINGLGITGTLGTSFVFPTASDDIAGRTAAQTFTSKTISGLTNTLSNIDNSSLTNNSITTVGNSGSGSVSLGGGLTFTGSGITNIVASGSTLTVTSTEADTLASVTGRGASTLTALTLNGGVTTTTSTALTLDSGTTGGISIGTAAFAKTITFGNTTGATAVNINSGTGNINFTAGPTSSSGKVQIGNSGTATADLLVLDNGTADPTGVNGGMYYNTITGKFRCFQNSVWTNCVTPPGSSLQSAATYKTNDTLVNVRAAQVTITSVSVTPSTATGDVYVRAKAEILSSNGTDQNLILSIEDNATCTGSTIATNTITITVGGGTIVGDFELAGVEVDAGTSSQSYSLCASTATGDSDIRLYEMFATVIDTGADLAEVYTSNDTTLEPGDVVSLDSDLRAGMKKSDSAYDKNVLGIVSTRPGLIIGSVDKEGVKAMPVALSGRVPVKVSSQNGAIKIGDNLTSSSIPGVAMKATQPGTIIGTAMSPFDSEGTGQVLAFVKNGFSMGSKFSDDPEIATSSEELIQTKDVIETNIIDQITKVISDLFKNTMEFFGNAIFHSDVSFLGRPTFNNDTAGHAVIKQGQTEVIVEFKKEYASLPVVNASVNMTGDVKQEQIPSYAVYDLTAKGFKIKLSQPATSDLNFSWITLSTSVDDISTNAPLPTSLITPGPQVTIEASPSAQLEPSL